MADDDWQAFATKWQECQGPVHEVVNGASVIDLSDIRHLVQDVPPSILVRTCYDDAVRATMYKAAVEPESGMIFTGQPGIGKTTFLFYLLVRLLQHHQIVLLGLPPRFTLPLLFYRGRVYEATTPLEMGSLPQRTQDVFIWSLFEANEADPSQTDYAYGSPILFPVQAPSPNPSLCERWAKFRNPNVSVLQLWDLQELKQGLQLQKRIPLLREELDSTLKTWPDRSRDSSFKYFRALQVLRAACGDERPVSVDAALDVLLDASIAAFGWVAHDVFKAIDCEWRDER
ncbi:hypothetical protein C8Q74DRAFT_911331 [Fomes fomentarius]|nr:hypothetical protein C8Q74DRAFT_911331 [Fomes fomentarius]